MITDEQLLKDATEKSEELFKRTEVKRTPFTIVEYEKKYYVSAGLSYRLSDEFETFEEAEQDAKSITWDRICQLISIITELKNK